MSEPLSGSDTHNAPDEPALISIADNGRPFPLGIFTLIALVFIFGIMGHTFWGENEAYYALGAKSVLRGDALLPTIYEGMPADKPPFIFWWVALVSLPFGGVTEFTARFANLIPSLAVLFVTFRFAARNSGRTIGLIAAMILATSYEYWENSIEVNTDLMLLAFLVTSWSCIFSIMERGFTLKRWIGVWLPMSLGLLTKGPVSAVLSGLIACAFAFPRYGWAEGWRRLFRLRPFSGAAICILPFVVWCAAVWMVHGAGPLKETVVRHNFTRFVHAFDHLKPWYYFFKELPINLLPWCVLLPFVIVRVVKRRRAGMEQESWRTFCITSVITVFVFFSLSSSKRDYYLLPLMPWMAMLLADCFASERTQEPQALRGRAAWGFFAACSMLAVMAGYFMFMFPRLDKQRSVVPLVRAMERAADDNDRIVIYGEEDPRIIYYLRRSFAFCDDTPESKPALDKILGSGQDVDFLASRHTLKHLRKSTDVPLYVEDTPLYRRDQYYIVTTSQSDNKPLLTDDYIKSQAKSGT